MASSEDICAFYRFAGMLRQMIGNNAARYYLVLKRQREPISGHKTVNWHQKQAVFHP
jgi:hypothetical protein